MSGGPALRAVRIARRGFPPFDGAGAAKWGGRWNSPGRPVIYAAETYALAVLESLVHFSLGELPPHFVFVEIRIPATVSREFVDPDDIPGWDEASPSRISRRYGDRWLDEARIAVLLVPSVLSPLERNVVINPRHRQAARITVARPRPADLDHRILRAVATPRR